MDPISKALSQTGNNPLSRFGDKLQQWKPGQSGNPSGRPRKPRITKIYERILAKAQNRKEIEEMIFATITDPDGSRMAAVLLLKEMAERTEGKIMQPVELSGTIATMSDEQVDERLTKLLDLNSEQHDVIDVQPTQSSTHEPERDSIPAK